MLQSERCAIFRDEAGFEHLKQRKYHEQAEKHTDENNKYKDGWVTPQAFPINEIFSGHHRKGIGLTQSERMPPIPNKMLRGKSERIPRPGMPRLRLVW